MPTKAKPQTREESNAGMRVLMKRRYAERRAQAIEFLGGQCARCGSTTGLELDHKDPATKEISLFKTWHQSERFWAEVRKCQLLCRPCHEAKTITDLGFKRAKGEHGTISSYRYCHCESCRKAKREYHQEWRQRRTKNEGG